MNPWLGNLIGLAVAAHGLVYLIMPLTSASVTIFQGWRGTSAVLGVVLGTEALKSMTTWLWILAGIGLLAAAGAMLFSRVVPGIWRPLALGGAIAGVASFLVFWDGQGSEFVNQGGVGLVISSVILVGALVFPRAFP